jgi:hypothetical protein
LIAKKLVAVKLIAKTAYPFLNESDNLCKMVPSQKSVILKKRTELKGFIEGRQLPVAVIKNSLNLGFKFHRTTVGFA